MIDNVEDLDLAVEELLKTTANSAAHMDAATLDQKGYDKRVEALAHHASAIEHYRAQPAVQKHLEELKNLVPHRAYLKKPIKLENSKVPTIGVEDLDASHPEIKGMDYAHKNLRAAELNDKIKRLHTTTHSDPQVKALHEHGARFLAHLVRLTELHNLEKKGEIPHAQFSAHLHAPEITEQSARMQDSKYRGHSHAGGGKFTTQSVTKNSGALWNPASPEHTALEEHADHGSAGKLKEHYPFAKIKVNGEPLKMRGFERDPRLIHSEDAKVNLGKEHLVRHPETGQKVNAAGIYYGSHSAEHNMKGMERTGQVVKKSEDAEISSYFPNVTVAHYVFAKNLLKAMNPFEAMTDEQFGEFLFASMAKGDAPSQQAAALAEAVSRLEKADKKPKKEHTDAHEADAYRRQKRHENLHQQGVNEILSGKVTPLPMTEAEPRSEKEGEKRDELADVNRGAGFNRKRSPYAVPADVFTDDTYSKVDPEKYKAWVHGGMTEDDLRGEHATYANVVRHNPEAQERHKDFIDRHKEQSQGDLAEFRERTGSAGGGVEAETPVSDHKEKMRKLGEDLKSGKITPQQFAERNAKALKDRSSKVSRDVGGDALTDSEKAVQAADPSYKPRRSGAGEAAAKGVEKDVTDIAAGRAIPSKYLAHGGSDESGAATAKELKGSKAEGGAAASGSTTASPSPVQLVSDHPGFKAYLQLKDHLLSHYKDPAVKQYMQEKIEKHENNPNFDVARLAGTLGMLHRSQEQAMRAGRGHKKMMQDIVGATDPVEEGVAIAGEDNSPGKGHSLHPESMMTPAQRQRLDEVRSNKPVTQEGPAASPPPSAASQTSGKVKVYSPEEKAAFAASRGAKTSPKKS